MSDFFNKEASKVYDEKNRKLSAIADNMHFLIRLVLKELPANSKILCVGVGTGAEILSLSKEYPSWSFVAVDPSESMLDVCRERLIGAGIMDRCELIHGYVQDAPIGEKFDAVVSVLVGHFVKKEDRKSFFENMFKRLRKGGLMINTELSGDLNSPEFPEILKNWSEVQILMGATPESLAALPMVLKDVLTVLPSEQTEELLREVGFKKVIRFFQSFMIHGWHGRKE